MRINPRYFPYPVLSYFSDDYVDCTFNFNITVDHEFKSVDIKIKIEQSSDELKKYIEQQKFSYVIHVECPKTSYRKSFNTKDEELIITIKKNQLEGKVEISGFIISNENIDNYKNDNFNLQYQGVSFQIEKGNYIAISKTYIVDIIKNLDELMKIPSIIQIMKVARQEKEVIYSLSDNKISIQLSEEFYENYTKITHTDAHKRTIHSFLIYPALIYTFEELKKSDDEFGFFSDLRWFQSLKIQLKREGIEMEKEGLLKYESYILAQKILGNPIQEALEEIANIDLIEEG